MQNKTNILFFGTTDYGFELSKSDENKFKELNTKLNIFVFTYGIENKEIDFGIVKIKYLKKPKSLIFKYIKFYFLSIFQLNKFISENNISVVSSKEPISALSPVLIKLFLNKNIKIIIENHGDFREQLLQQRDSIFISKSLFLTEFIIKFVFKHLDMLRGVNKQNSEYFKKYNKNISIYNFPAWIDSSIFTYTEKGKRNDILFVGNIIRRKGINFLIESISPFLKKNKHITFRIVGNKEDQKYFLELQDLIKNHNLNKRIIFLEAATQIEIAKLMNSSKVLVMGSTSEGLPRVLIEAGFCGLPAVATKIDGIYDPFSTIGGTLVFDLNEKDEFIEHLEKVYFNKTIWNDKSKSSFNLSNSISGNGKFVNNWVKMIGILDPNL